MNLRFFTPGLAVVVAVTACNKPAEEKAAPQAVPVEMATVEQRTVPVEIRTIGSVEPLATVQLKAKVQGEITKVLFTEGAYVKAGQPLFTIDQRPFAVALQRAEADLAQAQSQAQNAQSQADRYTKLSTQGVASKEQFADFMTTAASQKSVLAARQADVDQAKLSLEWATVISPVTGRAGAALLKAGNIVQANTDVLTVINQTQPIYVTFSVPETQLAEVRAWLSKGDVAVAALEPRTAKPLGAGHLEFIDNAVDKLSGMITMKATFPNADESLWPGQFVDAVITLTSEPDALVVPSTAIMEGQNGSQVFVVKDGVAVLTPVEIERAVGANTVIHSGLSAGEVVVSAGQLRVTNGAKVAAAPLASASTGHGQAGKKP